MSDDFLVELGTEELPPGRLRGFARDFHDRIVKAISDAGLIDGNTKTEWYCSPRRMAVVIPAVRANEPDRVNDRLGPAVKAAFAADGTPTKAAAGFAQSCGVEVSALEHRETDKGERLAYKQKVAGRPAAAVLAEAVTDAIGNMSIPRRMRWGTGEAGFIRPVHWLVMLHGDTVVDCELFGVRSGRESRGHRFHHPEAITITAPAQYKTQLHETGQVEVDDAAGTLAQRIQTLASQAAKVANGTALESAELATEVAALVERPVPVVGNFSPDFLTLPEEVIIAVLEGQQRYFPMRDKNGILLPHFIAMSNIESNDPDAVRSGNERVIRPRLADAMFFWDNDRAVPLATRTSQLADIVYQRGLGSLADKAGRVAELAQIVNGNNDADAQHLARAAALYKCDLTTDMVGEFAKLQGIMGGHYATAAGEPEDVALAIRDQYLPQHADDPVPVNVVGQCLALADKLDTIAGAFALGKKPSGNKDPFALRRAAIGIVRIALEAPLALNLPALVAKAITLQPVEVKDQNALSADIVAFIWERLRRLFEGRGVRSDVIDAVLALNLNDPVDIDARVRALSDFIDQPAAQALAAANKRSANILRKTDGNKHQALDPKTLKEPAEIELHKIIAASDGEVSTLVACGDYAAALAKLATLREPVDRFFEDVLVMDDDPAIRGNRLALLGALQNLFGKTADWARIQVET